MLVRSPDFFFFFFNDTATTEIYTLSLHDALPICLYLGHQIIERKFSSLAEPHKRSPQGTHQRDSRYIFPITDADRKSTRLNSSHQIISYAVFCLKKKK